MFIFLSWEVNRNRSEPTANRISNSLVILFLCNRLPATPVHGWLHCIVQDGCFISNHCLLSEMRGWGMAPLPNTPSLEF